jgi:hypothetical protein
MAMEQLVLAVALSGSAWVGMGMLSGVFLSGGSCRSDADTICMLILGGVAGVNLWNLCVQLLILAARS